MTIFMTFYLFLPYLHVGGGNGDNLTLALHPLHLYVQVGAGDVAGWVFPCSSSLITPGQAWGARDSPYK
jgi:hypothetical protein